jgi:hypothetical protein
MHKEITEEIHVCRYPVWLASRACSLLLPKHSAAASLLVATAGRAGFQSEWFILWRDSISTGAPRSGPNRILGGGIENGLIPARPKSASIFLNPIEMSATPCRPLRRERGSGSSVSRGTSETARGGSQTHCFPHLPPL